MFSDFPFKIVKNRSDEKVLPTSSQALRMELKEAADLAKLAILRSTMWDMKRKHLGIASDDHSRIQI